MTQIAALEVVIGASIGGLTRGLDDAQNSINGFGNRLQNIGSQVTRVGGALAALGAPMLAFGGAGLQAAADFDTAMSQMELFGGLAGEQLEAVRQQALQLGADTMFSATDAANAMLALVKAGQQTETAMSNAGLALQLAAVGGMNMENAANILATSIAQFNLDPIDESANVVDALASAANASLADIADIADALGNAGGVAAQFGLNLDETAAVLGVFANRGIRGAEAGTQLKSLLLNMQRTTPEVTAAWAELGTSLYDAQGNVRNFDTVIDELGASLSLLPVEEQNRLMTALAGSYGITGFQALIAAGGIDEMLGSMEQAPSAASLAEGAMSTFAGVIEGLKGSVDTLMINALTPLMNDHLKPLAQQATITVNAINDWVMANPVLASQIIAVGAGIGLLGAVLVPLGIAIGAVGAAIPGLVFAFGALSAVVGVVLSPLGALAAAFAGVAVVVSRMNFDKVNATLRQAGIIGRGSLQAIGRGLQMITGGNAIVGLRLIGAAFSTFGQAVAVLPLNILESAVNAIADLLNLDFGGATAFQRLTGELQWMGIVLSQSLSGIAGNIGDYLAPIGAAIASALGSVTLPDLSGLRTSIGNAIAGALTNITLPDLSGVHTSIETAINGIDLSGITAPNLSQALSDNLSTIISTGLTILGAVIGGPVGIGALLVRLIIGAIDSNFMGLGTALANSGALTSIQNAFSSFMTGAQGVVNTIFGGEGGGLEIDLGTFGEDLRLAVDTISGIVSDVVTNNIAPGLQDLANGISGFVTNLQGTDTSGLYDLIRPVLGVIGAIAAVAVDFAGNALGAAMSAIGAALPQLGSAINSFVSSLSALGNGDIGGFLQGVGEAVGSVVNALANSAGQLLGIDVEAGIAAWQGVGTNLGLIFSEIQTQVQTGLITTITNLQNLFLGIWTFIEPGIQLFNTSLQTAFAWLQETVISPLNLAIGEMIGVFEAIWAFISPGIDALKSGLQSAFDWIRTNVIQPVIDLITGIGAAISGITGNGAPAAPAGGGAPVAPQTSSALGSGSGVGQNLDARFSTGGGAVAVPGAASGAYILREGLTYLHAGERVLNPAETRAYERGGGGNTVIYLTAYGDRPRELLEMTRRAANDRGR